MELEGSEKYKEVNNNSKMCMKKAKENWIGEQCGEIAENLRKNNSRRAYQLVKDLYRSPNFAEKLGLQYII